MLLRSNRKLTYETVAHNNVASCENHAQNVLAASSRKRRFLEVADDDAAAAPLKKIKIAAPPPEAKPVYIMIFDVETTGLVSAKMEIEKYPYITQITMIIFDIMNRKIVRTHNHYIKLPAEVKIPEIVTEITGITRELCDECGISIIDALQTFYNEIQNVRVVVAHNIDFDRRVVMGEFHRNRANFGENVPNWENLSIFQGILEDTASEPRMYCTMKNSQFVCNIKMKNGGIKFPKLLETFKYYFPNEPEPQNLHNSMVDTLICLRCFVMMRWREDIASNTESGYSITIS